MAMGMTMHVDIVSLESAIFSGRSEALFATGVLGEMGIYPGHTPLLTSLKEGQIRVVKSGGEEEVFYVKGGLLEVQPEMVTVLADTIIRAADLDEEAAKEAKEKAEKALANKRSQLEYGKAMADLASAIAQLRAIEQLRKKYKI
jgi:F-type H+-transporting ATPase subunit epsilon